MAFLDHAGKLIERVPNRAYQLWSHDLDGDGGEELTRVGDSTVMLGHVVSRAVLPTSDDGRYDTGGRGVLIVSGVIVVALSIAGVKSLSSSPGMRGLPWGAQLAMAFVALPILAWPTAVLRSVFRGEWRRLKWLLGGSLLAAVVLALILLVNESGTMLPEQHYSWRGWWLVLFFGVFAVSALLFLKQVFGPGLIWLWKFGRRRPARHT